MSGLGKALWLIVASLTAILVTVCVRSQPPERDRGAAHAARRAATCVPAISDGFEAVGLVEQTKSTAYGVELFVNPGSWSGTPYTDRQNLAYYFSICGPGAYIEPVRVRIRDSRTGEELAAYSRALGYRGRE